MLPLPSDAGKSYGATSTRALGGRPLSFAPPRKLLELESLRGGVWTAFLLPVAAPRLFGVKPQHSLRAKTWLGLHSGLLSSLTAEPRPCSKRHRPTSSAAEVLEPCLTPTAANTTELPFKPDRQTAVLGLS